MKNHGPIARILERVIAPMYFAVEQDFDAQAAIVTAQQHDELPIFAICLYLAAVFWLPPRLEGTKPLSLRRTWALWNLALALFSCCGAARTVPTLARAAREHGLRYTMCTDSAAWYLGPDHRPCGLWMTLFIFSKIPELLDTIFLVAQQKDVIFLHWFHHVTVLLYCWHAFTSTPAATGLWFAAMNYSVHSVMYLYYFLSIAGLRRLARPIAPIITVVQIAQMAVGSGVTLLAARAHFAHAAGAPGAAACAGTPESYKLGLAMYSSYLVLFMMLFYANYLAPDAKHEVDCGCSARKAEAKKKYVMVCGVKSTRGAPFGDGAFASGGRPDGASKKSS